MHSIQEYTTQIVDKVKNLDLGVIAANAGYFRVNLFVDQTNAEIEDQVNINAVHVIYLLKSLVKQIIQRHEHTKVKTAVIVTSSISSRIVHIGFLPYSATKTFVSFIAEGLGYELSNVADVLDFCPGQVSTKMIFKKEEAGGIVIPVSSAVNTCFRDIGNEVWCHGSAVHELSSSPMHLLPRSVFNSACIQAMNEIKQNEEA